MNVYYIGFILTYLPTTLDLLQSKYYINIQQIGTYLHSMAIIPTRSSTSNTMGSSLHSLPDPIEFEYPIIQDNISILYDHLTGEEVEWVYVELEKKGIITVDGIALVDDHVLEAAGIPFHLVSLFREECRCKELIAEGFGVSAPWRPVVSILMY